MIIIYILFMTLGQFAVAVGAPARWVQNAFQALGLPARYTEDLARRLSFARTVKTACGMPLRQAFPLAEEALARWPRHRTWELAGPDGVVRMTLDLERFLSDCSVRLSLARCRYAEKRRGRPPKTRRRGIAWAKWYGVDISLLEASLRLTPEQRLRRLDEAAEFFRKARMIR
ncbi:MAG: hypothetical protein OER89_08800 [Gemmatimonadota bacterium]|nr:hypothetical protein [Gemmatimonadota bacterium]MDH5550682.1 hypothetical protein [Gemmatimonadota bacterium]